MPDVVVIGGGIAGISAAAYLSERAEVVLLEAEAQLAFHTTGRSAALFYENYGSAASRPLTAASKTFLTSPPDLVTDTALLSPRGGLRIGRTDQLDTLRRTMNEGVISGSRPEWIEPDEVTKLCPAVRLEGLAGGVWEPNSADLDVAALHQAFVRMAVANGTTIVTNSEVTSIETLDDGWRIFHGQSHVDADTIVNAAGAWGDVVADLANVRPIGLEARRRTVFMVPGPPDASRWPMVIDADLDFYFKPDGHQLLCSPAEEVLSEPCDARPRELDIALAIDKINAVTSLGIRTVNSSWTGLRTFSPDEDPVHGFEPGIDGFFWLVGQGGTGIQTSPAAGALTAALILDGAITPELAEHGVSPKALSPARFRDQGERRDADRVP